MKKLLLVVLFSIFIPVVTLAQETKENFVLDLDTISDSLIIISKGVIICKDKGDLLTILAHQEAGNEDAAKLAFYEAPNGCARPTVWYTALIEKIDYTYGTMYIRMLPFPELQKIAVTYWLKYVPINTEGKQATFMPVKNLLKDLIKIEDDMFMPKPNEREAFPSKYIKPKIVANFKLV